MSYSNGNSFSNGNSMDLGTNSHDLGSGASYALDGSRPPSAAWMFTVLVWKI